MLTQIPSSLSFLRWIRILRRSSPCSQARCSSSVCKIRRGTRTVHSFIIGMAFQSKFITPILITTTAHPEQRLIMRLCKLNIVQVTRLTSGMDRDHFTYDCAIIYHNFFSPFLCSNSNLLFCFSLIEAWFFYSLFRFHVIILVSFLLHRLKSLLWQGHSVIMVFLSLTPSCSLQTCFLRVRWLYCSFC